MGKNNKLPDRWSNYTNMGRAIPGTRFICFKVPLAEKYEQHGSNFSLRNLTDYCPQLGLVIDLTNTNKYYDSNLLAQYNVEYKKIFTEGHVLPSNKVVMQFITAVNDFLESNERNDRLVGVHCTHGVNRTGYLVCRYMIQVMDIAPDQAISDFDSARGHVQERVNYTGDLRSAPWIDEDPENYLSKEEKKMLKKKNQKDHSQHQFFGIGAACIAAKRTYFGDEDENGYTEKSYLEDQDDSFNSSKLRISGDSPLKLTSPRVRLTPPRIILSNAGDDQDSLSGRRRKSGSRRSLKGRLSTDSSSWAVTDIQTEQETESPSDRPRGIKRRLDESRSRAPWQPPCGDGYSDDNPISEAVEPPRLKFKRAPTDPRYGKSQSYDRYYYQQRQGGGPSRKPELPALTPTKNKHITHGGSPRKYKGPRVYLSPPRFPGGDAEDGDNIPLELEKNKPLRIPSNLSLRKNFLDSPVVDGPTRNPKSPCTEPGVFSPDAPTGSTSNKRRKSKRFEPY